MLAEPGTPPRPLMPLQSKAEYVEPGYLVFAADGALVGRRFRSGPRRSHGRPVLNRLIGRVLLLDDRGAFLGNRLNGTPRVPVPSQRATPGLV